jgi:hypothetical protein
MYLHTQVLIAKNGGVPFHQSGNSSNGLFIESSLIQLGFLKKSKIKLKVEL